MSLGFSLKFGFIIIYNKRNLGLLNKVLLNSIFAAALLLTTPFFAIAQDNPLQGSWKLVSGKYLDGKGKWVDYADLKLSAIKLISANHFSFTTVKNIGTTEQPKNEFWAAGTGRYQYTATDYVEFPELNSFGVKPGVSFVFTYELKGNEWHTKRTEGGTLKEVEVWVKLD
ncbi:hypothetical protein [Shewanella halifaxensis]|uniref:hypothetical protein n=1 Tax=Shewanella halifaxensis TaxID=271098 RepID=UPI001F233C61|nr:hypothetical protein [Shewanella halifaxensis]